MIIPFSNRTVLSSILLLSAGIIYFLFWLIYLREHAPGESSDQKNFLLGQVLEGKSTKTKTK